MKTITIIAKTAHQTAQLNIISGIFFLKHELQKYFIIKTIIKILIAHYDLTII